ncbi:CIC11C00000004470 [Sungouiella intermedia]|uniref:protein-tyrosine-phosphatase n=1 Tax=Sungouiella intermedia TaxID=45354 RepID=A0A1L0BTN8_9ASCO|nr:CIC11C00000004470 [[Candida] intermedia]
MAERILGGIYLLSIEPINDQYDFKSEYGITHVISVLSGPLPAYLKENYQHLQIDINDDETTNLLQQLPAAVAFINLALFPGGSAENQKKHNGAILIHCAQGKSRSVAVIIAYLMAKYHLSYTQALHAVTRKVADAQPNAGFVEQLKLFEKMKCEVDTGNTEYRQLIVANSLKQDPSGSLLPHIDVFSTKKSGSNAVTETDQYNLRCKMCRQVLASESDIEAHDAPGADSRQSKFVKNAPNSRRIISVTEASTTCSHYFMAEPLDWMRPELEKEELEGKFACLKCEAKVGGYSWRGSRCSCGKWMIPALHLQAAKVDKMKK